MTLDAQLGLLHDATLVALQLDWTSGVVILSIRTATGDVRLVVASSVGVRCPRECPWGPSASIGSARVVAEAKGGVMRLEIEMQSGDLLVVRGATVTCEPP